MTKENNDKQNYNIHKGHRDRLRQELLACNFHPVHSYKNLEYLLTYVFAQKDTNPLAHELIDKFGGFCNVLEARREDLVKVKGMGENAATFLCSLLPIFSYYFEQKSKTNLKVQSPKDYYDNFGKLLSQEKTERLMLIVLDDKCVAKKCVYLSSGTYNEVAFEPLSIYDVARPENCKNVVLIHNHPSGDPTPSPADINNTRKLVFELKNFKLVLKEHMIVSSNGYYSFQMSGEIDKYEKEYLEENNLKKTDKN